MVKILLPLRVGALPEVTVVTGSITAPFDGYAPTLREPTVLLCHQTKWVKSPDKSNAKSVTVQPYVEEAPGSEPLTWSLVQE